jgi:hypothetical protein
MDLSVFLRPILKKSKSGGSMKIKVLKSSTSEDSIAKKIGIFPLKLAKISL